MPGLFFIKHYRSYAVKPKPIKTSVVIVNYRADEHVQRIQRALRDDHSIEVLVVDHSDGLSGYGAGCTTGAQQAKGETVLFMNPDVEITAKTVHSLHNFLEDHPQVAMVGPQILDETGSVQITCSSIPTPLEASIVFSWLHGLPYFEKWQKQYRLQGFNHQTSRPVPAINGSCFMMRTAEFLDIGGCDKNLFLYFEEFDLAKRVHDQLEKQVYYLASCSVTHYGQISTDQAENTSTHFRRSRNYWLQKHYGFSGTLADFWIRMWERTL